jgi:hypothetical protein
MGDNGWYGFDLDGTLAVYDVWRGVAHIGAPIMPMVNKLKAMLQNGDDCRIFTARVYNGDGRDLSEVIKAIDAWCLEHVGRVLPVTNVKDFDMLALYDDRCVQVVPNAGYTLESERDRWREAAERREREIERLRRELSKWKSDYYNGQP